MSKLACIFPGQGSQTVGMGKDLAEKFPEAKKLFAEIDEIAGRSLSRLCFEGPDTELKRTVNTQPTILAVSMVAWRCYELQGGPKPAYVAGHSLGEFSALYAAGAFDMQAAVKLVDKRSQLMEACPKGAMSAVIGMAADKLEAICKEVSDTLGAPKVVIVANFNTKEQLVVSGDPEAVAEAGARAKAGGAKVIPLPVGGAFHSPLMKSAADEFEALVKTIDVKDAVFPVVQNVDAKPETKGDALKEKLSRQMPSSVRWCETIEYMISQGVDTFVEIGPGKALSGMVKKIDRAANVFNISDAQTLDETLAALKQTAGV
ncbi:MAG: ACP S-malonyltransferase [Candidatus Melainabacteria bacterium]|jgi:[acyl-carrier-protein] S-malonyltransferase|nr:ACP S-malonyltransferase [Candidatus Melainabacteria bacterium]